MAAACRGQRNTRRRGSNAIEFALILPVFIAIVAGIFEFGFYFFMRTVVAKSVREGCRTGAVIPPEDSPSPEDAAESSIKEGVSGYSFFGADCNDVGDARCEVTVSLSGSSPSELLVCSMTMDYPGLTGMDLGWIPDSVGYSSFALLEVQR